MYQLLLMSLFTSECFIFHWLFNTFIIVVLLVTQWTTGTTTVMSEGWGSGLTAEQQLWGWWGFRTLDQGACWWHWTEVILMKSAAGDHCRASSAVERLCREKQKQFWCEIITFWNVFTQNLFANICLSCAQTESRGEKSEGRRLMQT